VPHLDTHSAHSSSAQVLKEEREVCCSVLDILCCLVHYLVIVLAIYIKEVLLGFLPLEGFPGQMLVYSCDFVSLSDPVYAIVI
jgi:hypothetical protein